MPERGARAGTVLALLVTTAVVLGVAWFVVRPDAATPAPAGTGRPVAGDVAPDFTATTLDGATVTLSGLRGTPVWLSFGATWCADCRVEAPDISGAAASASDSVATLMVYAGDGADAVRDYNDKLGFTVTSVPDPDSRVAAAFRIAGVPTHYFLDRAGVVRRLVVGVLTREQMDAALAELAEEPAA